MSLGKNIKLMRKNAGWKKSELAEKCGGIRKKLYQNGKR